MAKYVGTYANEVEMQEAVNNGTLSKPFIALDRAANRIVWNSLFLYRAVDGGIAATFEFVQNYDGELATSIPDPESPWNLNGETSNWNVE